MKLKKIARSLVPPDSHIRRWIARIKLEPLLHRLWQDFGLKETEAKALLKALNFTTWPREATEARRRSQEIYVTVQEVRARASEALKRPADMRNLLKTG